MSINPCFAGLILERKKRVEFRKTRFSTDVSYVIIYATLPVQKVVGYFEVDRIIEANPNELWERYQSVAGTDHGFFGEYYKYSERAVAIEVGEAQALDIPVSLASLGIHGPPPQSFRYVSADVFRRVSLMSGRSCQEAIGTGYPDMVGGMVAHHATISELDVRLSPYC
jgi:predicted transcriptional regulator